MSKVFPSNISVEELNNLPLGSFPGHIVVIDNPFALQDMANVLHKADIVGFDTETRPTFVKGQSNKIAMMQLAADNVTYLVRLNKIGLQKEIIEIISNPKILKVGVSLRDDFSAINKIRHIKTAGFIDLQTIVGTFGIEDKSLKKLSGIILGIRISKSQQTSNWESEQLTEAQMLYAATDAWVCREMYLKLYDE
jgi:ribonuclease D